MDTNHTSDQHNSKDSRVIVDSYLNCINLEITNLEIYHHHKERMAWSATGAYMGLIVLAYWAAQHLHCFLMQLGFTLVIFLAAYATWLFIHMQFEMRWETADRLRAFKRIQMTLCTMNDIEFLSRWSVAIPPIPSNPYEARINLPKFIQSEIENCETKRKPLYDDIKYLLQNSKTNVNARRRSELASYIILILITIIALAATWCVRYETSNNGIEIKWHTTKY